VEFTARWLDVEAGEFLTTGQISQRNPGIFPLYAKRRLATFDELQQINVHMVDHQLAPLAKAEVGDEPVTRRLVAMIPVKGAK